ncbi:cytochrome c oxidase subunit I [Salipiger marinus]|uniref:cytochrome c oxidase subunit I n=1 Tax=Salipiger marinus TaxID=555512 RepID=UPI004058ADDE
MNALRRHRELSRIWASDRGWRRPFTTVNHSDLGRMFMLAAFFFFGVGGILAMMIRAQLATPHSAFMEAEVYNQIFTMHGTVMMFLFAIPLFEGLAVYLLPKLLGTRDLAFPRLTAYGFWCYVFGGTMLLLSLLAGVAPDGGWFMYPPLSSTLGSPGINPDFWLLGITFVEISAMAAAVELTVSILKIRAPGMSLDRMPIFAWYALVTSLMILTGFPPLILGSILLELERAFGLPFFQADLGGDSLLWQHLFWLFGHPEVYIIFLPAAGVISTILPVMARTPLMGYGWVVAGAVALGFLSFGLWVHHMFTTGIPHLGLALFSAASTLVAVPTAIQVFAWIGTLWKGRPEMHMPMLWIVAFFATFVIGGLTGVMVAIVPFNWQAHDTTFIVAHLHYVLVGGFVFPMLAALYYWLPQVGGRKRFFKLGKTAFWLIFLGFHGTFLLLHWSGLMGQRRRIPTYDAGSGWELINLASSISAFVMAIGFALVVIDIATNLLVSVRGSRNPWGAASLEWAMPTPPPSYNFASLPLIHGRDPLWSDPKIGVAIAKGEGFLGAPRGNQREILTVSTARGTPEAMVILPGNTALPVVMSAVTGLFFAGFLFKLYWLPPIAVVLVASLALKWAWSLGHRADQGPQPVGRDTMLPLAAERPGAPAWWGSVFLLLANATLFGSLLFGYAFLWTIAPGWPPPRYLDWMPLLPLLVLAGAGLASPAIRLAERRAAPHVGLGVAAVGQMLLLASALWLLAAAPDPTGHAYGATVAVIAGYAALHAALALLLTGYCLARLRSGFVSQARSTEIRIARLWIDYAGFVGIVAMAACLAPGLLQ